MKTSTRTQRHPMLLYRRAMDRRWPFTLIIALGLAAIWIWNLMSNSHLISIEKSTWIFATSILVFLYTIFTFISRYLAYIQVHSNHIRIATPFYKLQVSFRRFRRVYPADFLSLYPPNKTSSSQSNYLEPLYRHTIVVIELNQYPIPRYIGRLFFAREMFSKETTGFLLLVPDWMALSTEIDTHWGSWKAMVRPSSPSNP